MADICFRENVKLVPEGVEQIPCLRKEEGLIDYLRIPDSLFDDANEIVEYLSESVSDGMSVAFAYLDKILYARIYDGEKYVFPLPFMLTEDADIKEACINLSRYSRRELIPLIISDVPREELDFLCELFLHIDAFTYEDDDDSFFIKVNNECDMLDSVPDFELDGIRLCEILDSDKESYAELCRDRDLNKFWGYDVYADNPDADADFYLDVARREFADGVALTFAVRYDGEFVGEATVYDFDYMGSASVAVRILKSRHLAGLGSRALHALIELSKEIGLSRVRTEVISENVGSIKMTSKYMNVEKCENGKTYFTLTL